MSKRLDMPYWPGERAMLKVKQHRTADCVVGGFRYESGGDKVGSLLLGLYDDDGRVDHVGFTSAISNAERARLTAKVMPGFRRADARLPRLVPSDRLRDIGEPIVIVTLEDGWPT